MKQQVSGRIVPCTVKRVQRNGSEVEVKDQSALLVYVKNTPRMMRDFTFRMKNRGIHHFRAEYNRQGSKAEWREVQVIGKAKGESTEKGLFGVPNRDCVIVEVTGLLMTEIDEIETWSCVLPLTEACLSGPKPPQTGTGAGEKPRWKKRDKDIRLDGAIIRCGANKTNIVPQLPLEELYQPIDAPAPSVTLIPDDGKPLLPSVPMPKGQGYAEENRVWPVGTSIALVYLWEGIGRAIGGYDYQG